MPGPRERTAARIDRSDRSIERFNGDREARRVEGTRRDELTEKRPLEERKPRRAAFG